MGATGEEPVVAPFSCMGALGCSRFRVGRFYMKANNGGKVSNLTVAPHRNIPLPISLRNREAPLLATLAAAHGDTLHQL